MLLVFLSSRFLCRQEQKRPKMFLSAVILGQQEHFRLNAADDLSGYRFDIPVGGVDGFY